ncbi:hypothetical protein [Pelagibius sp. Alg239-R121]|uniref:hypothetical protein n=1 Tax=Pelagibius sp. Alg239-R121 TaxID=2993448 RepID=UPI0024A71B21|nr:hypothetical protein [Pelagibius sp. Alg239-R121]
MTSFADKVAQSFPSGISLPDELRALFDWMESTGAFVRGRNADCAMLYPLGSVEEESLMMFFTPADAEDIPAWFGTNDPDITNRVTKLFCTGGDGSYAGIWLDDDGKQQFVHLGSGSGSVLCCVVTDDPVDFLRLLAIGYEELCWPEHYELLPEDVEDRDGLPKPVELQKWVKTTFGVSIPRTASEIVAPIAEMTDKQSDDPFWRWTEKVGG